MTRQYPVDGTHNLSNAKVMENLNHRLPPLPTDLAARLDAAEALVRASGKTGMAGAPADRRDRDGDGGVSGAGD